MNENGGRDNRTSFDKPTDEIERHIRRPVEGLEPELELPVTLLMTGRDPDPKLYAEADRLKAERDWRLAVVPPLFAIKIFLATVIVLVVVGPYRGWCVALASGYPKHSFPDCDDWSDATRRGAVPSHRRIEGVGREPPLEPVTAGAGACKPFQASGLVGLSSGKISASHRLRSKQVTGVPYRAPVLTVS